MEFDSLHVGRSESATAERAVVELVSQAIVQLPSLDLKLHAHNEQNSSGDDCVEDHSETVIGNMFDDLEVEISMGARIRLHFNLVVVVNVRLSSRATSNN